MLRLVPIMGRKLFAAQRNLQCTLVQHNRTARVFIHTWFTTMRRGPDFVGTTVLEVALQRHNG